MLTIIRRKLPSETFRGRGAVALTMERGSLPLQNAAITRMAPLRRGAAAGIRQMLDRREASVDAPKPTTA